MMCARYPGRRDYQKRSPWCSWHVEEDFLRMKMTKVLFSGFIRHITKDMTKMNFFQFLCTQKGLSE